MQEKLRQIGDKSEVKEFRSVAGGDINNAYYVKTEKNKYFIKTNEKVPSDFFSIRSKRVRGNSPDKHDQRTKGIPL